MDLFADILLPVPLDMLFTYGIPSALCAKAVPGARAYVPFGKGRKITGVICSLHHNRPKDCQVRDIIEILDNDFPTVLPSQIKLFSWMWDYHICPPGDVLKAALPAALRPDGSHRENSYKPKTETYIRLGRKALQASLADIAALFPKSCKAQMAVFSLYLELSGAEQNPDLSKAVSRKALTGAGASAAVISKLVDGEWLEQYDVQVGRLPQFDGVTAAPAQLSPAQQLALQQIRESFKSHNVTLLHGVTSSGKTEVYIHLIKEQISHGRQVLYLLPEIALTTQIMHRLTRVFGPDICVCHSRLSDGVRAELWKRQAGPDPYKLVLGARSAVLMPFQNLGLIIVDEEHEPSFKQEDPAPRYHGRNTAIVLSQITGARVLLGSATPSLESYCNAQGGKYGLVRLTERYRNVDMPQIETVDTADLRKRKYMQGMFSPQLIDHINRALQAHSQTILFLNRRGYAGVVECPDCGWIQKCDCCDVSLTFHKSLNSASCHYCGRHYQVPSVCPSCQGHNLRNRGYGTERIQEDVERLFPAARVARLDLDSARSGYETILSDFEDGRTDILIGTQMISKGLDFDNVSVVGILKADAMLSAPDFRAAERAYQLMAQVAGRAGRRNVKGHVIIQTTQPDSTVLQYIRQGDFYGYYASQMEERRLFSYPPYTRLTVIWLKGVNGNDVDSTAVLMAQKLASLFQPFRILGPDAPQISRVQFRHLRKIIVKAPLGMTSQESRSLILKAVDMCRPLPSGVTLHFDVDPQ